MFRPLRIAFTVALAIFTVPSSVHANKLLAWLEELSGPGPFHGWVLTADVACIGSPPTDAESAALLLSAAIKATNGTDAQATQAFDSFMATVYQRPSARLADADVGTLYSLLRPQVAVSALNPNAAPDSAQASKPIAFWEEYEKQQRRFRRCRVDRSNNIVSIQLEVGRYHDDASAKSYEGNTQLTTINAIAYLPIERLVKWDWKRSLSHGGRFIEVGTGAGAYGLSGSSLRDRDLWRGVVPFRVRVVPSEIFYALYAARKPGLDVSLNPRTERNSWRRLLQSVEYRFGQDLVLGTLDHDLFSENGPVTSDQTHEWVRSYGFNFDLGIAFRALIGH